MNPVTDISTNDFPEVLQSLLGTDAKGLSASTVTRLKAVWEDEYAEWSKRSLAGKRYVYMWADGIYSNVRFNDNEGRTKDENRQCLLVLMGATADGTKELIAVVDGHRESELSWKEVLLSLKARGLMHAPELAILEWNALGHRHVAELMGQFRPNESSIARQLSDVVKMESYP